MSKYKITLPEELDRMFDAIRFDGWLHIVEGFGKEATIEALIAWTSVYAHQSHNLDHQIADLLRFFLWDLEPIARKRMNDPIPLSGRFLIDAPKGDGYAEKTRIVCQKILDAIRKEANRD